MYYTYMHTIPYRTVPYRTVPYRTVPYHMYTHSYIPTYLPTYLPTYIHTYIHTCIVDMCWSNTLVCPILGCAPRRSAPTRRRGPGTKNSASGGSDVQGLIALLFLSNSFPSRGFLLFALLFLSNRFPDAVCCFCLIASLREPVLCHVEGFMTLRFEQVEYLTTVTDFTIELRRLGQSCLYHHYYD